MRSGRVATVATRVFEPEGSAAAYRLGALVRALEAADVTTTVLTTRSTHNSSSTVSVRRWPVLRDRTGAVRGYLQYASFDIPLFFRLAFGPRADVVIAEPPPTTGVSVRLACWLRRTPYVYFSADVTSSAAESIGTPRLVVALLRVIERWVLRGALVVLAVSDGVRDEVNQLGAKPESVEVVGTGIDTDQFSLDGPCSEASYPYFVYAGTMSEMQGAGVFVDAFAKISTRHPTARLKVFGEGIESGQIRTRAQQLGQERIDFLGQVNAAELAPWLRGAHAGLASSRPRKGYNFAISTKALVSLSCGTPVLYAGNGPIREIVNTNDLGWAVDWNVEQVAEAMDAALQDAPTQSRRRHLATWASDHHSLSRVASIAVEKIVERLPTNPVA